MPLENKAPKRIERTLDSRVTAVYYPETKWLELAVYDGPGLNFVPESVAKLHDYLNDPKPAKSTAISELYTAELDDGWLTLVIPVRHYNFSELATLRLKEFLNEVVLEGQEGHIDAH